jgi:hypothetical protein
MFSNWFQKCRQEIQLPRNTISVTMAMVSNKKLWYITTILAKTGLPKIAIILIIALI